MILRDLDRLREQRHTVLIVGGGLQGAALLLEAALRGHSAALIERDDFGGGASGNSLRIAHGGVRDLQRLAVRRCRAMAAAQRAWLHDFPDLVETVTCALPLDNRGLRRAPIVAAGLAAHAIATFTVRDRDRVPAGRLVDLDSLGCRAAQWHEGLLTGPRLTVEMLRWAGSLGAVAANRVELVESTPEGLAVLDRRSGETFELRARHVILATGHATDAVLERLDATPRRPKVHPSLAFNLLFDRPGPISGILALPDVGGTRLVVPVGRRSLVGTFHAPIDGERADPDQLPTDAVDDAIRALHRARPDLELHADDVVRVLVGVLPVRRRGTVRLLRKPIVRMHRFGLTSVVPVKWSTTRHLATRVVDRCLGAWPGRLDRSSRPEPAPVPALDAIEADEPTALDAVRRLIAEEAVHTVEDLMRRRTDWALRASDPAGLAARLQPLIVDRDA